MPIYCCGDNGGGGGVESVVAGTGIAVDATDPANPIVSSTVSGGNFVLIQSQDDGSEPITFNTGIAGNDASILGYQIRARLLMAANDNVALTFNNDTTAQYSSTRTVNDGAGVTSESSSAQTTMPLVVGAEDDTTVDIVIDIPVSGQTGSGFNRGQKVLWHARCQTSEGADTDMVGGGTYAVDNQITRIDLIGTIKAGSRAALYKITR